MSDPLLTPDHAEAYKALIHVGLFGFLTMVLGYNAMAWTQRRERHLAVNTVVYAAGVAFELVQIKRHIS